MHNGPIALNDRFSIIQDGAPPAVGVVTSSKVQTGTIMVNIISTSTPPTIIAVPRRRIVVAQS